MAKANGAKGVTTKRGPGRPPLPFDKAKAAILLDRLAMGESMRAACKALKIPRSTVYHWLETADGFADRYAKAREQQAQTMIDVAQELVKDYEKRALMQDEPHKARIVMEAGRQMVGLIQWQAAKQAPKLYGDKLQHDLKVSGNVKFSIED